MTYQKIVLSGNLGSPVELRYMANGTAVANFPVATNRSYTKNDEKVKETTWFRVTAWGKQAESCNQYLDKGSSVLVEGRLTPDQETGNPKVFERKDGTFSASFEITADRVVFLSAPKNEEEPDF